MGVAVATLPTSSSACIIFLMRDGGNAAVEDLRRPMAGDPSIDTPDRDVRAFTWVAAGGGTKWKRAKGLERVERGVKVRGRGGMRTMARDRWFVAEGG